MESGQNANRQLKLPDHLIVREGGHITVVERRSGNKLSFTLPVKPVVRTQASPKRFLAGLASAVLVVYLASTLMEGLLSDGLKALLLVLIMVLPFPVQRASNGRVAILAYLVAFVAFAAWLGALRSGLRLGVVYFGGGPGTATSYALVPASTLLPILVLGILPYAAVKMLGQVLVRVDVLFPTSAGQYLLAVSRRSMADEIIAFLA